MKRLLKNILFSILHALYPHLGNKASILMYHSIGESGSFFTVTKEAFERQMRYLSEKGLNIVSLGELINQIESGKSIAGCIVLTFDDGYRDNYDVAFPVLKKYSFPATIFIATDFIGKTFKNSEGDSFRMLSEEMIREMSASGLIEFMPHTKEHAALGALSKDKMQEEIEGSREVVERMVKTSCRVFSYPKGKYTSREEEYLKGGDWLGAVTVREGLVAMADNPFVLKRNSVDSCTSFVQFKGKVSQAIEIYSKLKRWLGH